MQFQRNIRSLAAVFLGRSFAAAGAVLLTLVIAKKFSISDAGNFVTAFAILMTAVFFSRFGLDVLAIKVLPTLADHTTKRRIFLGQASTLALTIAFLLSILFAFVSTFVDLGLVGWLWICLIPFALINLHGAFLRASGHTLSGSLMEGGLAAFVASLFIAVLPLTSTLQAWWVFTACCWFVFAISCHALARNNLLSQLSEFSLNIQMLIETHKFGLVQITSNLAQWGGLFIIAAYLSSSQASETNALFRLIAPLQFIFLTLDFYLGPKFSAAVIDKNAPSKTRELRRLGIKTAMILSLPFFLLILLAGNNFINLLLNPAYQTILYPLLILTLAHVFVLALGSNGILLNVSGHEHSVFIATLARAGFSLLFYIVAVPFGGLWAVCLIFAFSIVLEAVYFRLKADKVIQSL